MINYDPTLELKNCNFLKTVLMFIIVLYHSILFWTETWLNIEPVFEAPVLSYLAEWFNSFHIYAFTLVSGYIFYYTKHEKCGYDKFIPFLKNKAKRLIVPYAFIAAVWVIPIQWIFFKYDFETILEKYILATSPSQLWFLIMLFDVFIIFWLLSAFFKKYDWISVAVVIAIYCVGLVGNLILPNIFCVWTACRHVPFFLIGFKIRQHGSSYVRRIPISAWIFADLLLFIGVQYFDDIDHFVVKLITSVLKLALYSLGSVMAFVTLQRIADKVKFTNKIFNFISANTMTVYLLHQQLIYFTIYWLNGKINPYFNAIINFVFSMIVSIAISAVLMRFNATRFLVGEKKIPKREKDTI